MFLNDSSGRAPSSRIPCCRGPTVPRLVGPRNTVLIASTFANVPPCRIQLVAPSLASPSVPRRVHSQRGIGSCPLEPSLHRLQSRSLPNPATHCGISTGVATLLSTNGAIPERPMPSSRLNSRGPGSVSYSQGSSWGVIRPRPHADSQCTDQLACMAFLSAGTQPATT
jgi:hypothetical protein